MPPGQSRANYDDAENDERDDQTERVIFLCEHVAKDAQECEAGNNSGEYKQSDPKNTSHRVPLN